jgi:hypothetical protein
VSRLNPVFANALTIGLVVLHATGAFAAVGPWNFSAGPQLAWSWGKPSGISWGWESGAGLGLLRFNLGQITWKGENLSYAVLEPYTLYFGGTLGIGYENKSGLSSVLGLWEGVPVVYPAHCEPNKTPEFGFLLTVAIGYRYFGGHHQIYLTPKAGVSQPATACGMSAVVSGGTM